MFVSYMNNIFTNKQKYNNYWLRLVINYIYKIVYLELVISTKSLEIVI